MILPKGRLVKIRDTAAKRQGGRLYCSPAGSGSGSGTGAVDQREVDREDGSAAHLGPEGDLASVGNNDLLGDGQPQTGSARFGGEVRNKDLLPDLFRDAGAVILNLDDRHLLVPGRPDL